MSSVILSTAISITLGMGAQNMTASQEYNTSMSDGTVSMREGRILSVDCIGRVIVISVPVEQVDTFVVRNDVVISGEKDLKRVIESAPVSPVRIRYVRENGKKIMRYLNVKPVHPEIPEPIVKNEQMIVAEGRIKSIENAGNTMIFIANADIIDTFTLDSNTIIRAERQPIQLADVSRYSVANVQYVMNKGKKVLTSIIGKIKKH
jgi:hypothetical protein